MEAKDVLTALNDAGVSDVRLSEPLALHTTWRIGGPADVFVVPKQMAQLQTAVQMLHRLETPVQVIGRGSNLLVADDGIRGAVIKLGEAFSEIRVEGQEVYALAGRSAVSAANIAIRHNLAGLEFATGIPGTVGGAVMMNAGAHGGQVSDVLVFADVIDEQGNLRRLSNRDLCFRYRYSIVRDQPLVVAAAAFALHSGDGDALAATVREWSQRRAQTQPLSLPSCGSVFRNPDGCHAGELIEGCGLKGMRRGGAQISDKHANFIVNCGGATAADVLWLIQHAQNTVKLVYGIELEPEVRVFGEASSGR